jgi:hypothetical protein
MPFSYQVFDASGKLCASGKLTGENTVILPVSGVYAVQIKTGNKLFGQKVMVK